MSFINHHFLDTTWGGLFIYSGNLSALSPLLYPSPSLGVFPHSPTGTTNASTIAVSNIPLYPPTFTISC
ncbi:hypothetical protein DIRU0_E18888 [Diutina rugosa]